jgi:hypothetical protein
LVEPAAGQPAERFHSSAAGRADGINEAGRRFIPFIDPARLGVALMVGFLIGLTIGRRSARRRSLVGKPYQEFA